MEEEQKFKYTSVEFNRIIVLAIRVQLMRLWGTGTTAIVASSCQWFMCFRQFMRDTERVWSCSPRQYMCFMNEFAETSRTSFLFC